MRDVSIIKQGDFSISEIPLFTFYLQLRMSKSADDYFSLLILYHSLGRGFIPNNICRTCINDENNKCADRDADAGNV